MLLDSNNIAKLGEMATLFEVSAYPKPGNVHRTQDFDDMSYEDFLISSVCIRKHLELVADKSYKYYPNMLNQIKLGENILGCVEDTNKLVETNTNLGISLLFMPIAATCGVLNSEDTVKMIPNVLDIILKNTTTDDAISFVKSIVISKAGGMDNKTSEYDVTNSDTIQEIMYNNVNLYDLLQMSSKYDKLSYELTNRLPVIFDVGYPTFINLLDEYPLNDVTLETYLKILSTTPDTLISRKYGDKIANEISQKAEKILNTTEISTKSRLKALTEFDKYLYSNKYNPGTTADFTAASIFVSLIDKYSQTNL